MRALPQKKSVGLPVRRIIGAIAHFAANQAIKTTRQPSRVILIPYRTARHYLIRPYLEPAYRRLLQPTILRLSRFGSSAVLRCVRGLGISTSWMPRRLRISEANYYFQRGDRLLGEDRPEDSWHAFERRIKYSNEYFHFVIAAVCLYVGLGRMREAIRLFQRSNEIRLTHVAPAIGRACDRYCLLDGFWPPHIGHTANIDYVVKLRTLEGRNPEDTILYVAPHTKVANRFLLEQWKPHLRLVTDPHSLPVPEEYLKFLSVNFYVPHIGGGKHFLWELAAQTYRRWADEGREPLLRLPEDVKNRGRKILAHAGVPADAWFVGLHVREPGYQPHHRALHGVLNGNIQDYLPAIDEIVQRGGWVIRMGDPSMSPLPHLPNVLDYCHSAIRSDWMDVFLAASSRFFIGTSSGVCYVAQDYGVPCVLTNWWPPAQRPWQPGDIFVPKLIRPLRGGGPALSLEQGLNEPFGYCNSADYLRQKHGLTVQDNDPEDIRAAVAEMLDRLDGRPVYDQTDIAMRARAERIYAEVASKLYDSPAAFGAATLARDFLRRNPTFLRA